MDIIFKVNFTMQQVSSQYFKTFKCTVTRGANRKKLLIKITLINYFEYLDGVGNVYNALNRSVYFLNASIV